MVRQVPKAVIPTGYRKGQPTEYRDAALVLKTLIWDGPTCGDINAKLGVIKTVAGWVKFRGTVVIGSNV